MSDGLISPFSNRTIRFIFATRIISPILVKLEPTITSRNCRKVRIQSVLHFCGYTYELRRKDMYRNILHAKVTSVGMSVKVSLLIF
jgi:hypothetical protein